MSGIHTVKETAKPQRLAFRYALLGILLLWIFFAAVHALFLLERITPAQYALFGFIPGILGVSAMIAGGGSLEDSYIRYRPPSKAGIIALALSFLAMVPILIPAQWAGFQPLEALVYAPASGIAQELFFRSALLPAVLVVFKGRLRPGRLWPALLAHSTLFGLWHIGVAFTGAPFGIVLAVMAVPFLTGLAWGWQTHRDGTVLWAAVTHTLILIINSFFTWG